MATPDIGRSSKRRIVRSTPGGRFDWRNARLSFEHLEDRRLLTITWTNPVGGDWDTPTNWSSGAVPGSSDDVVIGIPGITITHALGSADSIHSLNSDATDTISIFSGSLSTAAVSTMGNLNLSSGTITGSGDMTFTGIVSWSGGTMTGTGKTIIANTGSLNISSSIHDLNRTLENDGTSTWTGGDLRMTGGTFQNNSSFTANSAATLDSYGISGTNAFVNAGTFTKQGTGTAQLRVNSTGVAFQNNGGEVSVQAGTLLLSSGGSVTGSLTLSGGGALNLSGTWTSPGPIKAVAGSTMNFVGTLNTFGIMSVTADAGATVNFTGTVNNTNGILALAGSGAFVLSGGTINFGTVNMSGGAKLTATAVAGWLVGLTLNGDLDLTAVNNAQVIIYQNMTFNGTATLGRSGSYGYMYFYGSNTLSGTATIVFATPDSRNGVFALVDGSTLTIGPGITIRGQSGYIGYSPDLGGGSQAVVNQGTISADTAGGTITLEAHSGWTNTGAVQAKNGGTLFIHTTPTNFASSTLTGGTWQVFANSTLRIPLGPIVTNAANILLDGANSNFFNRDAGAPDPLAGLATNATTGSFTMQNGRNFTTAGAFINAGNLTVGSTSTFTIGTAGSGTMAIQGGVLSGTGTVSGNVTNAGTVAPGSSPGILNISGNYTQTSAGALNMEIGGTTVGSQFDQLNVIGTATLDGTLNVSLINGFVPSGGQSFPIVTFASHSGAFATVNGLEVGQQKYFTANYNQTNLTLAAVGAAANLSVSLPASVVKGQSFNFTITAKDSFGNTATGYTGTVHFTSSDPAASLPADYTFVSTDNGIHTFAPTLNTVGSQSITATDTLASSVIGTGTSSAIPVVTMSWTGAASDNNWNTAGNWNLNRLPGAADDVYINVDNSNPIITSSGTVSINRLVSNETLSITGGSFAIATPSQLYGGLNLSGGTLINTNNTLALSGSGTFKLSGGTINGGTVNMSGGAKLTATSGTLNGVTLNGDLDVLDNAAVDVTNGLTLNGTATLHSGGGNSFLAFDNTETLGGTGTVVFAGTGSANTVWVRNGGTTLTIGPNITIRGQTGYVGYTPTLSGPPTVAVVNQGTISADTAGQTITLRADNGWTNQGTVQATGGTITLGSTFMTAASGTIGSNTGSTVNFTGTVNNTNSTLALSGSGTFKLSGGTINGGTVNMSGGAKLTATSGTLNGVTLNGDLDVLDNAAVDVTNGLTLNGTATLHSGGGNSFLAFDNTETLGGTGTVVFAGTGSANTVWVRNGGTTLTIGPNITIRGQTGYVGYTPTLSGPPTVAVVNQGTISADTAGQTITLRADNGWTNGGTIEARNGGTLTAATTPTNFAAGKLTGGTWQVFANSTLRVPVGSGVATNAASILLDGGNSNFYTGTSGTTDALSSLTTNAAAGSFTIQNGRNFIIAGDFTNSGSLTVGPASTFTIGTAGSGMMIIQGGSLIGAGTITGNVTNAGTIGPGQSPGMLTITGNYTQTAQGTLNSEIGGLVAGSQFDQVNVSGTATLDGTLNVSLINNFVPGSLQNFSIMTFASRTGAFATVNGLDLGQDRFFSANYNQTDVTLVSGEAAIIITPQSGLITTESGGTASFTVVLASQPQADVSIGLSSNNTTEGTVSPTSLTFTSADWNLAQTVTVTGVADQKLDGDTAYAIVTAAAVSADPSYNGLDVSDVAVTNQETETRDLQVANLRVDPASGLQSGSSLVVRWDDTNTGDTATDSSWSDYLQITNVTTGEILATASVLYDATVNGPLAGGTSRARQYAFTLPSGARGAGQLQFTVTTDYSNQILERNNDGTAETNNTASISKTSDLAAPDLQVFELAVTPASPQSGNTLIISWNDANSGNLATSGFWNDRVVVENATSGQTLLDRLVLFDKSTLGNLAAGGTQARQTSFTLLDGSEGVGDLHVTVTIDSNNNIAEFNGSGTGENNNTSTTNVTSTLAPYPDLVAANIAVDQPANVQSGNQVTVGWDDQNIGNAAVSNSFTDSVLVQRVNADNSLTTVASGNVNGNNTLAAGGSSHRTFSFTMLDGVPGTGTFLVTMTTDSGHSVKEYDTSGNPAFGNNTATGSFTSTLAPYPDLTVANVAVEQPANVQSGNQVTVGWDDQNIGNAAVSSSFFDSVLVQRVNADNSLTTVASGNVNGNNTLAAGGSSHRTFTVTLLDGVAGTGTFRVTVTTDSGQSVKEYDTSGNSSFSNNTATGSFVSTLAPYPDLFVSSIIPPADAWSGRSIAVSWTVMNQGMATTSGTWTDSVYLSDDATIGSDLFLGNVVSPVELATGQSYTRTQDFTVPDGLSGNYRVVVNTNSTNSLFELNSTSDTAISAVFPFHLTPYADLQVSSVTVPDSAAVGQSLTISWTVVNAGTGATNVSNWSDRVDLSTDPTFQQNVIQLGTTQNPSYLGPGDSYSQSLTAAVPAITSGQYYVRVTTDSSSNQYEYQFENNNSRTGAVPVQIISATPQVPFLHVAQVTVSGISGTIFAGQAINLAWDVQNTGTATFVSPGSNDIVVLSPTPTYDGVHGSLLASHIIFSGSLPVGSSYHHQVLATLPQSISGTWYAVAIPEGGATSFIGNEGRDTGSTAIQIQIPPAPDLQVRSLSGPDSAVTGQSISLTWAAANNGFGITAATAWTDAVYLSSNATLQTSGPNAANLLGTFTHNGSLSPLDSYTTTQNVIVPQNLSTGAYYLIVFSDSGKNVFENAVGYNAEANNTLSRPISIQFVPPVPPVPPVLPDLIVTAATPPVSAFSGQTVMVRWTVQNQGPGFTTTGQWSDKLVFSQDNDLFTAADNFVLATVGHSGALISGSNYTSSTLVTLPIDISGLYHCFVVADSNNQIAEGTGESNNTLSVPLTISLTPPPLLQVSSITLSDGFTGKPLSVQWTVTNAGAGPVPPSQSSWTDRIYLANSGATDPTTGLLLGSFTHNGTLNAGDSYNQSQTFNVPNDFPAGPHTLFAVTDAFSQVFETGRGSSNISSHLVNISQSPPADLGVSAIIAPANATSGQPLTISWQVTNHGTGPTVVGGWQDAVYLSTDQFLDKSRAIVLGSVGHNAAVSAGGSYTSSLVSSLPASASGPYYVIVLVDSGNAVYEPGAKANNVGVSSQATVVGFPPLSDLTVTSVTAPATGIAGQSPAADITWSVVNQGANAAVGSWYDSVYLSPTPTWDVSDPLVARVAHVGDLAPGASYPGSTHAALPGEPPGSYYVIVRTDILNNVRESNEANNLSASASTIALDVPVLPPGQTTFGTILPDQNLYYRIDTQAGQNLLLTANFTQSFQAEFYVRFGSPPTRNSYDTVYANLSDLQQQITISSAPAGSYFILLVGREGAAGGQSFTLSAQVLQFGVRSVTPNSVGNAGQTTVTVEGSDFSVDSHVSLVTAGGQSISANQVWWISGTELKAAFDLTGQALGQYDVRVSDHGQQAMMPSAVNVANSDPGRLDVKLVGPGVLRPGQQATFTVNYTNVGGSDLLAPMFQLTFIYNTQFSGSVEGASFRILASSNGSATIAPGAGGSQSFTFTPRGDALSIDANLDSDGSGVLDASGKALNLTIDWAALKDQDRPSYIPPDAWDVIWSNFTSAVGNTLGQYKTVLAADSNYLQQLGTTGSSVDELTGFLISQADDSFPTPVLTSAVDLSHPAPGISLDFSRTYMQPISGRFTLGPLGRGWADPWDESVSLDAQGNVTVTAGGSHRLFVKNSNGSFSASPGDHGTLTFANGQFSLVEAGGTVEEFRSDGRLDSVQDTHGNRVTCVYTGALLTQLLHSNGDSLALSYNTAGRITQVSDSAGRVGTYAYDASNEHLLSVTNSQGVTSYSYDSGDGAAREHALLSIAYPSGTHTYFTYDARGRLASTSADGGAQAVMYAYDSVAGVTVTDAANDSTRMLFNLSGNVGLLIDPLGRTTRYVYNANNNLIQTVEPNGVKYLYSYDTHGNLVRSIDPLGDKVQMTYSLTLNRLTSLRDARSNTTSYAYDPQGDLLSITYPDGSKQQASFDPLGDPIQLINQNGDAINYTYDNDGRLTRKTFADGSHVDYGYDAHGNLTSATDSTGTIALQYDAADRLTKITYPDLRFLQFTYDAGGRRTQMVDQDGFATHYSYDALGRLAGLTDGLGNNVVTYTYDAVGRLSRKDMGNGTYSTDAYDAAGELLHLINYAPDGTVNSRFDYTYDALGQRTSMVTLDGQWTYGYDLVGQLTHAVFASVNPSMPNQDLTYVYDPAGNRLRTIENGVTTVYTTNNLNQYTTVGGATYTYDADGNLISQADPSGSVQYAYNVENRLTSVTNVSGTTTYHYNALGNRVSLTVNGLRTDNLVDPLGLGNLVAQYGSGGSLLAHYTYGRGLTSRVDASSVSAYYDFDAIGNTADMTNASAAIVNHYSYLPFGQNLAPAIGITNPFQFSGQFGVTSEGNGLEFMRARFYDTETGRFDARDPIGLLGGLNNYAFATNNPVSFRDPSGLFGGPPSGAFLPPGGMKAIRSSGPDPLEQFNNPYWKKKAEEAAIEKALLLIAELTLAPEAAVGLGLVYYIDELTGPEDELLNPYVPNPWTPPPIPESELPPEPIGFPSAPGSPIVTLAPWITLHVSIVHALDPNDKVGPTGVGDQQFVSISDRLPYKIDFENVSTATAPAHTVTITDKLDPNLDPRTLQLGEIAFSSQFVSVPAGLSFYSTILDLRPQGQNLLVEIDARIDPTTSTIQWTLKGIDPDTGETPVNPLIGLLPPDNDNHDGEGYVTYTVRPKTSTPAGTVITNQATVVFDTEAPLTTNSTTNTIDAVAPSSAVAPLPALENSATFTINWSGQDDTSGSGIGSYNVYVSDNGAAFTPILLGTTTTSATFIGQIGHTYAFYSVATDNVGNVEAAPATPDAVTQVALPDVTPPTSGVTPLSQRQSSLNFQVGVTGSDSGIDASGVNSYDVYVAIDGSPFTLWQTLPAANPVAMFMGASNHTYAFHSIAHDNAGNVEAKATKLNEASTYVPDLTPPETQVVSATPNAVGTFTVQVTGSDAGGSGLSAFDVFVQIDGGMPQAITHLAAGAATAGVYSAQTSYQGLADGTTHAYRFYSTATDGAGNAEAPPIAPADVLLSATFATPLALQVTSFSVQHGLVERSFIRYVDVTLNQSGSAISILDTSHVQLLQYSLDGQTLLQNVNLANKIKLIDHVMELDFGSLGLGGSPNSIQADGYYKLLLNLDGSGFTTERDFYRLFGDVNGDHAVDSLDLSAITSALGQSGSSLNADVNGDGSVNTFDRTLATRSVGRRLAVGLHLD